MNKKTWIDWVVIIYCSFVVGLMIFCIGHIIGFNEIKNQYEEQKYINENLYKAYEELRNNYDVLEIQYKKDLEDCQTMFGDYQDKVESGCYVNGGWNCE